MNELIYLPLATLVLGGVGGYYIGRYQAALIDKIRTLEQPKEKFKPAVTMGEYQKSAPVSTSDSAVGVAETSTPELIAWENENATEKEGLGL